MCAINMRRSTLEGIYCEKNSHEMNYTMKYYGINKTKRT